MRINAEAEERGTMSHRKEEEEMKDSQQRREEELQRDEESLKRRHEESNDDDDGDEGLAANTKNTLISVKSGFCCGHMFERKS